MKSLIILYFPTSKRCRVNTRNTVSAVSSFTVPNNTNKLTTVIPDLDAFQENVVEGAANVSFSKSFAATLKNKLKSNWLTWWQNQQNLGPSERWPGVSLPPSLMMLRAGTQQVEAQERLEVWSSGWDWRCSSSTMPSSNCGFSPSQSGLLQHFKYFVWSQKVIYSGLVSSLTLFASWFFFLHEITCKIAFTHSRLLYVHAILLVVRSIFQTLNTHR